MKIKNIRIVINPASGKQQPVLAILNEALKESGLKWDIDVSKEHGDIPKLVKSALKDGADAVVVCGGDGTVSQAAAALIGSDVPLYILPGGSANILAGELGISKDLKEALKPLCEGTLEIRAVDAGKLEGRHTFVRAALGFEAEMVKQAGRGTKNKFGILAYFYSAAAAAKKTKRVRYDVSIDGREYRVEGLTCVVTNAGNLGFTKTSLDKDVDVSDGLLDVFVVRKANLSLARHIFLTLLRRERPDDYELVEHWQGKDIRVASSRKQVAQCDGEEIDGIPFHIKVLPGAVRMLVPKTPA